MQYFGVFAFVLVIGLGSYCSDRIRRLEAGLKKLKKRQKEGNAMSKLIEELVGKDCKIKTDAALQWVGSDELSCHVLDADEDWVKVCFTDKKKRQTTKLLRVEKIDEVELGESEEG